MKSRLVLLYTPDSSFDQVLAEALFGMGTIVLIARSVSDALQLVYRRGPELDLAILDFNEGCRGMTVLSALYTCFDGLPTVVIDSSDSASAVAYANGARALLNKPLAPAALISVLDDLNSSRSHLTVA